MTGVSKETLNYRKQNFLCVECGNKTDGLTTCCDCRERRKKRRQERRDKDPERYKKLKAAAMARHRKKAIDSGICWRCGKNKVTPGQQQCKKCANRRNEQYKVLKQCRINSGLCKCCGKSQVTATKSKVCWECYFKNMSKKYLGTRDKWTELESLFVNQGRKCRYTGIDLVPGVNSSLDHIVPKAAGGLSDASNFQWVYCGRDFDINMMKRNFSELNFLKAVKAIYEYNENISTMVSRERC